MKYRKNFVWTKKAWYCRDPHEEKTIYLGFYSDIFGVLGQIDVIWDNPKMNTPPRLEVYANSWEIFADLSGVISEITRKSKNYTQEELVGILLSCGFADLTEYEDPLGNEK